VPSQGIDWNPRQRQGKIQMVDVKESLGLKMPFYLELVIALFVHNVKPPLRSLPSLVVYQEALSWGFLLQGTVFFGVGEDCLPQGDGTSEWRRSEGG